MNDSELLNMDSLDFLNDETLAQALLLLSNEKHRRMAAEAKLEAQRGKVLFADAVSASTESILVRDLAKELKQGGVDIGETRLFEWFRGNGYMMRQPGGRNMPTQLSLNHGWIEIKETVNINAYGRSTVSRTAKITPKGQAYFFAKIMADKDKINAIEAEKKSKRKAC